MVKNLLENVEYVEPQTDLPIPEGMCVTCNNPDYTPVIFTLHLDKEKLPKD